jgi:tetratricopeptide (TPR) repeat protein
MDIGELDRALEYFKKALEMHHEVGYKREEAQDLRNIGKVYKLKCEPEKALKFLEKSLEIYRTIKAEQSSIETEMLINRVKKELIADS